MADKNINNRKYYPLTIPQKNIVSVKMVSLGNKYEKDVICFYFVAKGAKDDSILEKSFNRLVYENDSLRLRIEASLFNARQYIGEYEYETLERVSVENWDACKELMKEYLRAQDIKSVGHKASKLYLAKIISCGDDKVLFCKISHMCFDGYSLANCVNKLAEYYNSYENNLEFSDTNCYPSITKYLDDNYIYQKSRLYRVDCRYWKNEFKRHKNIEFPIPRRKLSSKGLDYEFVINGEMYKSLKQLSSNICIPANFILIAAIGYTINDLTKCKCFTIAPLTHGRSNLEYMKMIGCMNNIFLHFFDFDTEEKRVDYIKKNYMEYLDRMRHGTIGAGKYLYNGLLKAFSKFQTNYYGLMLSAIDLRMISISKDKFGFGFVPDNENRPNQLYCSIIDSDADEIRIALSFQEKLFDYDRIKDIEKVYIEQLKNILSEK